MCVMAPRWLGAELMLKFTGATAAQQAVDASHRPTVELLAPTLLSVDHVGWKAAKFHLIKHLCFKKHRSSE